MPRVAVCKLNQLVESPLSVVTRSRIQELFIAVTTCTDVLLQQECYREASGVLQLAGSACRKVGETLQGEEHQSYILKVTPPSPADQILPLLHSSS